MQTGKLSCYPQHTLENWVCWHTYITLMLSVNVEKTDARDSLDSQPSINGDLQIK